MLDLTTLAAATTLADVMALLPTQAPDVLTHVVLNAGHPLAGQVLAIDPAGDVHAQCLGGFRLVLTPDGSERVAYGEIAAQCFRQGNPVLGEAHNWSRTGLVGSGFYATQAEAVANLPALAADAEKTEKAREARAVARWHSSVNARY